MEHSFCNHNKLNSTPGASSSAFIHAFSLNEGTKRYTGIAQCVIYSCLTCDSAKNSEYTPICSECASELESSKTWHIQGLPEIKCSSTPFSFSTRQLYIPELENIKILAAASYPNSYQLLIFSNKGKLIQVDCVTGAAVTLREINSLALIRDGEIQLIVSNDHQYCAITSCVYRKDEYEDSNSGLVIDLSTGKTIKELNCDYYHMAHTPFPVTFFEYQSHTHLVYASEWNKLDIVNIATEEILSTRNLEDCPEEEDGDDFTFTEWNGALVVSPDKRRIATVGWMWHPIGVAFSFDARKWIETNCWEPDIGESKKSYAIWDYFWDSPLAWIDDKRLCIWGAQSGCVDDPADCAAIFDADSSKILLFFTGPTINFFEYDEYLFSGIRNSQGLSIWSVEDGSLLHEEHELEVDQYLPFSKEFISFKPNGKILFTKWELVNSEN